MAEAAEPDETGPDGHGLKRELGLADLVLTQILYVIGLSWVGTAAKLGTAQIPFWLGAMACFFLPQAAVVIWLSRRFPYEGGLYQWAKVGLNRGIAFLTGWNLWVYAVILLGAFGIQFANAIVYAIGPSAASLSGNKVFIGAVSGALIGALVVTSVLGLRISKWIHNAGGALLLVAFAILLGLPLVKLASGELHDYHPFTMTAPAFTLFNLNIGGKLAVGALSGFEYVAVFAGESKNASKSIAKSVIIAAPVIAIMFILGTSSIQALVPIDQVDLVGPIPQAFRIGLGGSAIAAVLIPFAVMSASARSVANSSVLFNVTTRMPMVAGWDNLMPAWFARLHPKYKTPVNSILFIAACALVFAAAGLTNVGEQEAFQLLDNAAGILYGLTYLVLFGVPLFGLRNHPERPPLWLRAAAALGFATTVGYTILSIFPIVDVASVATFALKISSVVILTNLIGVALYMRRRG